MEKTMTGSQSQPVDIPTSRPWLMLISRSALFLAFQLLIALVLVLAGKSAAWREAARYWPFMAILANIVSIYLLVRLYREEGMRYLDAIKFSRGTWKKDVLWFLGASLIGLPIISLPMTILGQAFFGDRMIPTYMLFQASAGLGTGCQSAFPDHGGLCGAAHLLCLLDAKNCRTN